MYTVQQLIDSGLFALLNKGDETSGRSRSPSAAIS